MAPMNQQPVQNTALASKLGWLILGRLLGAVLLLWIGSLWARGNFRPTGWRSTITILFVVTAFTVGYAVARRLSGSLVLQIRLQFLIDITVVTWLVWVTNDAHSPYIALYIVIIALASIFLGPRDA